MKLPGRRPRVDRLVIGLPVHRRHWCLDRWFDSLEAQDPPSGTRLVFLLSEQGDPSEQIILRRWPQAELLYAEGLPSFAEHEKDHPARYAVLAELRNRLLRTVAALGPEYYLSWDSDILLEPGALGRMIDTDHHAVGALVDMGGKHHPGNWSWMTLNDGDAYRPNQVLVRNMHTGPPFPVGVIMGVKLMSPWAYRNVRYADHVLGEDIGWAIQAEAMGIRRWLCPTARGQHLYRLT